MAVAAIVWQHNVSKVPLGDMEMALANFPLQYSNYISGSNQTIALGVTSRAAKFSENLF